MASCLLNLLILLVYSRRKANSSLSLPAKKKQRLKESGEKKRANSFKIFKGVNLGNILYSDEQKKFSFLSYNKLSYIVMKAIVTIEIRVYLKLNHQKITYYQVM